MALEHIEDPGRVRQIPGDRQRAGAGGERPLVLADQVAPVKRRYACRCPEGEAVGRVPWIDQLVEPSLTHGSRLVFQLSQQAQLLAPAVEELRLWQAGVLRDVSDKLQA